jgi:hypothetical protein
LGKKISRREVIKITAKTLVATYLGHSLIGCASSDDDSSSSSTTSTTLYIPPVVTPDSSNIISLQANEGTTQFYSGFDSVTKGFIDVNNTAGTTYLGPTIRVSSTNANSTTTGTPMVDQGTQKICGKYGCFFGI